MPTSADTVLWNVDYAGLKLVEKRGRRLAESGSVHDPREVLGHAPRDGPAEAARVAVNASGSTLRGRTQQGGFSERGKVVARKGGGWECCGCALCAAFLVFYVPHLIKSRVGFIISASPNRNRNAYQYPRARPPTSPGFFDPPLPRGVPVSTLHCWLRLSIWRALVLFFLFFFVCFLSLHAACSCSSLRFHMHASSIEFVF